MVRNISEKQAGTTAMIGRGLGALLLATTTLASGSAVAQTILAQSAQPDPSASQSAQVQTGQAQPSTGTTTTSTTTTTPAPVQLPTVSVQGAPPVNPDYKVDQPSLPKFTEPLRDTPKSITVIPQQVIQDRGALTLRDVVRTVPGLTFGAGEGGVQGDNLTLRGQSLTGSMFLDGMRDSGNYYRDAFNYDSVEVLEGPDSIMFGRGSTGGIVNQVSKAPRLGSFNTLQMGVGTDFTKRATLDSNYQINDTAAFRVNLLATDQRVADRDVTKATRFGFAPSLALGLGTPTRATFSYLHQEEDGIPDYGVSWLFGRPLQVPRDNYYGFENSDHLRTTADILTAKVEHDFNDKITIRNQTRYAQYTRDLEVAANMAAVAARGTGPLTPASPLSNVAVTRQIIGAKGRDTFLENQTDATFKFDTFGLKHTLVSGLEIGREESGVTRPSYPNNIATSALNPNSNDDPNRIGAIGVNSNPTTFATTLGVYAVDTLKINEMFSLMGGLRWDDFDATTNNPSAANAASGASNKYFSKDVSAWSWRGSVIFKPMEIGTFYVSAGTSFDPAASTLNQSITTANTPPQKSKSYEVGTKWDVLHERIQTRAALFQTVKKNYLVVAPAPNPDALQAPIGEVVINGMELAATGRITDVWQIIAGYTILDSKVTKSTNPNEINHQLGNTPHNSVTLWSTYKLPWQDITVGGGALYVGKRYAASTTNTGAANSANPAGSINSASSYWRFDAMARYPVTEAMDLQLNVQNIFDKKYYDQVSNGRVVPGAGPSAMLSTTVKF